MAGATRDLTSLFMSAKQKARNQDNIGERFKPKSKLLINNQTSNIETFSQRKSADTAASSYKPKALSDVQNLPPVWIDIQEDVDENMLLLKNLFLELQPLRQQRFGTMMFDDQGANRLDFNISRLVQKISGIIKDCEHKLK